MKEKFKKIISFYGINHQQRKFQEEVFELQEAINKYEFAYDDNVEMLMLDGMEKWDLDVLEENIIQEIADVCVMLHQFVEYYQINPLDISRVMGQKIDRQLDRMKEEK